MFKRLLDDGFAIQLSKTRTGEIYLTGQIQHQVDDFYEDTVTGATIEEAVEAFCKKVYGNSDV